MLYIKKEDTIEAIQWTGSNLEDIQKFVGDKLRYNSFDYENKPLILMTIYNDNGTIDIVKYNDYIIKFNDGSFGVLNELTFNSIYVKIDIIKN